MPSFFKGPDVDARTPFGKNVFLRSTRNILTESYTFAKSGIPTEVIDGSNQKVLQPGTIVALITSGADNGKLGVFSAGATDGREDVDNIVGINYTFLPWQLLEHDEPISVIVGARVVQANCIEYNAADEAVPLTDTTADALIAKKSVSILFA